MKERAGEFIAGEGSRYLTCSCQLSTRSSDDFHKPSTQESWRPDSHKLLTTIKNELKPMCSSNKAWDNVYSSGWGIIKQIWGVTLLPQIRICPRCASHIMLWQSPSSSAWRTRPPQRASPAVFQTSHSPSFCHALARVVPLPGVYFSFFMLLTPTGSSDRAKSISSSRLSPSSFLSDSHPNSIRRPSFVLSLTIPRFLPSSFGQSAYEWDPLSALSQQARGISGYKIADSVFPPCIPNS